MIYHATSQKMCPAAKHDGMAVHGDDAAICLTLVPHNKQQVHTILDNIWSLSTMSLFILFLQALILYMTSYNCIFRSVGLLIGR